MTFMWNASRLRHPVMSHSCDSCHVRGTNTAATKWRIHGQETASSRQPKRQIVILTNARLADSTHDLAKYQWNYRAHHFSPWSAPQNAVAAQTPGYRKQNSCLASVSVRNCIRWHQWPQVQFQSMCPCLSIDSSMNIVFSLEGIKLMKLYALQEECGMGKTIIWEVNLQSNIKKL